MYNLCSRLMSKQIQLHDIHDITSWYNTYIYYTGLHLSELLTVNYYFMNIKESLQLLSLKQIEINRIHIPVIFEEVFESGAKSLWVFDKVLLFLI